MGTITSMTEENKTIVRYVGIAAIIIGFTMVALVTKSTPYSPRPPQSGGNININF